MSDRLLFLVPARAGSERIPGKNLREVDGLSLVGRALRLASRAAASCPGGPHWIVCSTDDPDVADIARASGATVVDRPTELATATAGSVDVALHALGAVRGAGDEDPEAVVLLQPTSPLTDPDDVIRAVAAFRATRPPAVVSIARSHPAAWHVAPGAPTDVLPGTGAVPIEPVRSEPAGADHVLTGAIYVIAPSTLRATRRFVPEGALGLPVPIERSIDVDEPGDLLIASAVADRTASPARASGNASRGPAPVPMDGETGRSDRSAGPRTIALLTTGRQDWGILHSTATAIRAHPDLRLRLLVGGMHLSPRHGFTVDEIRADGFEPDAELAWLGRDGDDSGDPPATDQAASALADVGSELRAHPVDALVLAGDRFETLAAAVAATLERTPIVHLHGGEQTLGAFDDALRHAITKLSHLHLVSHPEHAARVIALGEDPAAVHVVGTPSLDAIARTDLPDRAALEAGLGLELRSPVVLVTVHPTTLDADPAAAARAVAIAMDDVPATYVVTLPNVDPGAAEVHSILTAAGSAPQRVAVAALGERRYWGLLRIADVVLGNSSSGIAEAPALGVPVVNVGDRQAGRRRSGPVVDVAADPVAVAVALRQALATARMEPAAKSGQPAVDGRVGERIAHIIAGWQPSSPPRKAPIDVP